MNGADDKMYEKSSLLPTASSLKSKRTAIAVAVITVLILIVVVVASNSSGSSPSSPSPPLPQQEAKSGVFIKNGREFSIGAVSSTHYLAAQAGYETLREGGNAVDAAAVIQFVLNVVQPQSTGIGGGCFVLLYNSSTGEASALDGREEAPGSFHENAFCADAACGRGSCNCTGGLLGTYSERVGSAFAVGAPGVVAAMERMLGEKGTMTLAEAVKPAVKLARNGFPMYEHLRSKIEAAVPRLKNHEASCKLFLNNKCDAPKLKNGEIFKNPDLADTLEQLGKEGGKLFYTGQIANEIVETLSNSGPPLTIRAGLLSREDLSGYRAVWRRVVNTTYRGYQVLGMSPPSAGGVTMANALNVMEGFDVKNMAKKGVEMLHRMIDGMNMAWSDRNKYLADPDWVDIPVRYENDEYCEQFTSSATCPAGCGWNRADGGSEEGKYLTGTRGELRGCRSIGLLSKDYANARRDRFSSLFKIAQVPLPPGNFSSIADDTWLADYKDKVGTTHLSVIDRWGNMVSMTTTIEENLGTGIVVKGRGFLLNNELTDFSFNSKTGSGSGYANRPEGGKRTRRTALGQDAQTFGGKRPRSSMTPTIVLTPDGKPFLAIGTPGGGRITYTVFNALLAILDRNETLKEAIDAPRCISMNGVTELESAYNCNCSSALPQDRYLVSALRARGLQFTTSPSSSTSPYLEAALLRPDASLSCYADQQRMQTAQAFCEGKLDVSGWKK